MISIHTASVKTFFYSVEFFVFLEALSFNLKSKVLNMMHSSVIDSFFVIGLTDL